MEINSNKSMKRLGTFDGVFVPTLLTILGVVMYLKLGWVVGNAGLFGTLAIISIAHLITLSTALSMSSIVSNINLEDGGAYAIICRSLGMEWGGAVGIPLYFSQAFSAAFYIIGFVETWAMFFPDSNFKLVSFIAWLVLFIISYVSAEFAFKIQYVILFLVGGSIVSFLLGDPATGAEATGTFLRGDFAQADFWTTFAIFFPAVTGILAGVTMSGELKTPRKSIIKGTLAALITGLAVYLIVAFWLAHQATEGLLLNNEMIMIDLSRFPLLIVGGLLGAILSSALSTLVGAPRTLNALAQNRAVPFSQYLSKKSSNGEPRIAILVSSFITLVVLLASNLDGLAELLTLFFLTTYGMINLIILFEKLTGVSSFRPRLKIPVFVPVIGFIGCIFAMFLINTIFSAFSWVVIFGIYFILKKKHLESPWGDVRGGIFSMVAEWAAEKNASLEYHPRLWKPSLVVPVEDVDAFNKIVPFMRNIIYPSGRLYYMSIREDAMPKDEVEKVDKALEAFRNDKLFATKMMIEHGQFDRDFDIIIQSMLQSYLPPNAIFFTISDSAKKRERLNSIMNQISMQQIGLICMRIHPEKELGQRKEINLWLRGKSPNLNLAMLCSMQIQTNWNAKLNLIRVINDEMDYETVKKECEDLIEEARLPVDTNIKVLEGTFFRLLREQEADLTILGMPPKHEQIFDISKKVPGSVMFVQDSGLENILV